MLIPGLVSISFRQKTPEEIIALCGENGLRAIEWGGDVHVPAGDVSRARQVLSMTRDAGLEVCSYGSYYRLGQPTEELEKVLDCAQALQTDVVRIWAGSKGSALLTQAERRETVEQLARSVRLAADRKITLALEYHGGTLTDSRQSVRQLLEETKDLAYQCYWQPRWDWSEQERLAALEEVLPRLSHLHVFTWTHPDGKVVRLPLEQGEGMWKKVFSDLPGDHYALMEFVENNSQQALARDAACLLRLIEEAKNT